MLYVADLDRSLAFYRDLLHWPVIIEPGPTPAAGVRAGNTHHDLLLIEVGPHATPVPAGPRLGMYHFGVKVGDTLDELKDVLQRLRGRPDLASILGLVDGGFVQSAYVSDPDGNEVELYIDVRGWDWTDPELFAKGATNRCPLNIWHRQQTRGRDRKTSVLRHTSLPTNPQPCGETADDVNPRPSSASSSDRNQPEPARRNGKPGHNDVTNLSDHVPRS